MAQLAPMADVVCTVDFIIGTSWMTVAECMQLGRHSVVRLAQVAGSDVELRVHGVPIASGEVAVIEETAAVRISRFSVPTGVGWE